MIVTPTVREANITQAGGIPSAPSRPASTSPMEKVKAAASA